VADIKGVTPEQAQQLMDEGWIYVDVRSEPEFEQGHPPGALNVPLLHAAGGGMQPNPEFLQVMQSAFTKQDKLLLGCRSGGRSRRAAEMLLERGYTELADLVTGWEGTRDDFGRPIPGWGPRGFPAEAGLPAGQRYQDVKRRNTPQEPPSRESSNRRTRS
jgi:rhodanese-related sulfurtransferase